ncbi:MAG TPA: hypothetical protein VJ783_05680 [Pirellulales bacterium]|nr:hypothetical protein [Pirellulales bacterium]
MARKLPNGRAPGAELLRLLLESIILVDIHYPADECEQPPAAGELPSHRIVPRYDMLRKELWYDGKLIKQFVQPSRNQEAILEAFELDGWPLDGILDPLKPNGESEPAKRLRDALAALNKHQQTPDLLRFGSNGTGQGARWGLCGDNRTNARSRANQRSRGQPKSA